MVFFPLPDHLDVIMNAVDKFGINAQFLKAVEELSELSAVLARYKNGQAGRFDILEEYFDVVFMLQQLHFMMNITADETSYYMNERKKHLESLMEEYT